MTSPFTDESERSLAETASIEEGVLYGSSVELRQSHKKISTLKRKSAPGNKPPPRPTPGSVTYTDDESDKAYDHNPDESSLTEKPSEISSTDSQVRHNSTKDKLLAARSSFLDVFKVGGGQTNDILDTDSNTQNTVPPESTTFVQSFAVLPSITVSEILPDNPPSQLANGINGVSKNSANTLITFPKKKPFIPTKLYPGWANGNGHSKEKVLPQMPSPS